MELLKDILPFISILSVFGLYVIRSENKIHNLELEKRIMTELTTAKEKIAKIEADSSTRIAEISLQISHGEKDIQEIKNQVSEIYKIVVGG